MHNLVNLAVGELFFELRTYQIPLDLYILKALHHALRLVPEFFLSHLEYGIKIIQISRPSCHEGALEGMSCIDVF